jgi:hypothetical protein
MQWELQLLASEDSWMCPLRQVAEHAATRRRGARLFEIIEPEAPSLPTPCERRSGRWDCRRTGSSQAHACTPSAAYKQLPR